MQDPLFNLAFVLIVVAALATVIIVLVRASIRRREHEERHQAEMERQAAARLKRIVDAEVSPRVSTPHRPVRSTGKTVSTRSVSSSSPRRHDDEPSFYNPATVFSTVDDSPSRSSSYGCGSSSYDSGSSTSCDSSSSSSSCSCD